MKIVKGDILNATEDFILQQCNCLTVKAHGLSETLGNKFPHARVYNHRKPISQHAYGSNIAIEVDRAIPGTAVICTGVPGIICLFSQWRPGKITAPYFDYYPESNPRETELQRLLWFISSLTQVGEYFRHQCSGKNFSIAIPNRIGCGLAGGNWEKYFKVLQQFEEKYKAILTLTIYDLS